MTDPTPEAAPRAWRMPWSWAAAAALLPPMVLLTALAVRPDLWLVERVVFEGHDRAGVAALRHLADIENGTTVWGVDLERAAAGVRGHPWVREARAEREGLDTVRIAVKEHHPVALLAGGTMRYVCPEGQAFAPADTDDLDYPVITGVDAALVARHPELPRRVIGEALRLLTVLSDTGVVPHEQVGEVAFSSTRGFTLHLVGGAQVVFDLEGFERQARRLARLRDEGVDLRGPVYVDLAPADVAIVRPIDPRTDRPREARDVEG